MADYLTEAGTWADVRILGRSPRLPGGDPLFAVVARARYAGAADEDASTP